MDKQIFWIGLFMQSVNVVLLLAFFIPWTPDLFVKVVLGVLYGLFNIASIVFMIIGLASKK